MSDLRPRLRPSIMALLVGTGVLTGSGLVMLFGIRDGDRVLFARQSAWMSLGWTILAGMAFLDYRNWRRCAWPLFAVVNLLLMLVFVPGIGRQVHGANRWIQFGGFTFQPSELAKLTLVIVLAAWFHRRSGPQPFVWIVPLCVIVSLISLLMSEVDFVASFITCVVGLRLMALGGASRRVMTLLYALPVLWIGWIMVRGRERLFDRLSHLLPPIDGGSGSPDWLPAAAMESAGWTGRGLGEGSMVFYNSPGAASDHMAVLIGEQFGWLGLLLVAGVLTVLLVAAVRISQAAPDRFGRLLGFGIVGLIEWQTVWHIGANSGLLPNKSVPLPFVSYGGSALCTMFAGVGLLLSIARAARPPPAVIEGRKAQHG